MLLHNPPSGTAPPSTSYSFFQWLYAQTYFFTTMGVLGLVCAARLRSGNLTVLRVVVSKLKMVITMVTTMVITRFAS